MFVFGERRFNLILWTTFVRGNEFAETYFYQSIEVTSKLTIYDTFNTLTIKYY